MPRLPLPRRCLLLLLYPLIVPGGVFADTYAGRVVTPDERPVPGARVVAQNGIRGGERAMASVVADAEGRFTLEYTPPAPVRDAKGATAPANNNWQNLSVSAMPPEGVPYALGAAVIKPGEENASQNIVKLSRPDVYSGTLRDGLGRPLANVLLTLETVHLSSNGVENVRYIPVSAELAGLLSARTDAKGAFRIERMPADAVASPKIEDPYLVLQEPNMAYRIGEPVTLRAQPGGVLSGRVVDAQGKALKDATVTALWAGGASQPMWRRNRDAKTGEDGTFRIPSLMAGKYTLSMSRYGEDPLVSYLVHDVAVVAGQDNPAPDILAMTPSWVTGKVVNARTQEPMYRATITVKKTAISPEAMAWTDQDGQFKVTVVPGQLEVTVQAPSRLWGTSQPGAPAPVVVTVGDNATSSIGVIKVDPGEVLQGRMVDEKGEPLPEQQVVIGSESGSGAYTKGDAEGRFSLEGLKAGVLHISGDRSRGGDGEWQVVSPKSVTVPTQGEIVVQLRRAQIITAKGRVLTAEGQPVADARIHFKHEFTPDDRTGVSYGRAWSHQTLRSEADGSIVFKGLKPDSTLTMEKVEKEGYLYDSGGKVEKRKDGHYISDIVLRPLSKQLQGVVTDAAGQPVPDALIWSPRLDLRVRSSATGQFSLPAADTAIEVWAAKGRATGQIKAEGDNLKLTLREAEVVPERDLARALPLLRELATNGELDSSTAKELVTALAPLDPVMALTFASKLQKNIAEVERKRGAWPTEDEDGARRAVIQAWSLGRPGASASEGREVLAMLDEIENAPDFIAAATSLGIALAKDEVAPSLLERATAKIDPAAELVPSTAISAAHLAALAATLGSEEADKFFNLAVTLHAREPKLPDLMGQALAQGPADLVRRFVATLSPEVRPSLMNGMPTSTRLIALNYAIPVLAPHDPEAAYELLFEAWDLHEQALEGKERNYNEKWIADATYAVIKAYGPKRPDLMPDLARWVRDSSRRLPMMALGARYSTPEDARQLLTEAVAEASQPYGMFAGPRMVVRLAAAVQETNPTLAKEIMQGFLDERAGDQRFTFMDKGEIAYYMGAVSPEEARALLELEWTRAIDIKARQVEETTQPTTRGITRLEGSSLALGMAPLDWERAVAWARLLEPESRRYALARLALWALRTREGRFLYREDMVP